MQVEVEFTNLSRSLAFQSFILKHLKALAGRLDHPRYKGFGVTVRVRGLQHKPTGTLKSVETEFNLQLPRRGVVVIRKKGKVPEDAFNAALSATETYIRRETEKRDSGRRTLGRNQKSVRALKRGRLKTAGRKTQR